MEAVLAPWIVEGRGGNQCSLLWGRVGRWRASEGEGGALTLGPGCAVLLRWTDGRLGGGRLGRGEDGADGR